MLVASAVLLQGCGGPSVDLTYNFDGTKTVSEDAEPKPAEEGRMSVSRTFTITPEVNVFQNIQRLLNEEGTEANAKELRDTCEAHRQKNPAWLTLYFCLGVAETDLGEAKEAKKHLKFFIRKSAL